MGITWIYFISITYWCYWKKLESNCFFSRKKSTQKKYYQKQPSRCVLRKRCSENTQQVYRGTNTHAKVRFQESFARDLLKCFATLLKSHFGMGVLLQICCIFPEQLFIRTPLHGSSNINEIIRAVLNSLFFFIKGFYTHTYWQNTRKNEVLTSYVLLVCKYKQIGWSENFISYVLSVNVKTLKIIINLMKRKNTYKQTKTKKAVFFYAQKRSKEKKFTYFALT